MLRVPLPARDVYNIILWPLNIFTDVFRYLSTVVDIWLHQIWTTFRQGLSELQTVSQQFTNSPRLVKKRSDTLTSIQGLI